MIPSARGRYFPTRGYIRRRSLPPPVGGFSVSFSRLLSSDTAAVSAIVRSIYYFALRRHVTTIIPVRATEKKKYWKEKRRRRRRKKRIKKQQIGNVFCLSRSVHRRRLPDSVRSRPSVTGERGNAFSAVCCGRGRPRGARRDASALYSARNIAVTAATTTTTVRSDRQAAVVAVVGPVSCRLPEKVVVVRVRGRVPEASQTQCAPIVARSLLCVLSVFVCSGCILLLLRFNGRSVCVLLV